MAQQATESEFTLDTAAELAAHEEPEAIRGRSPWYLAWRRLRRNYIAFFFLFVFIVVVVACALAPVYAKHVAGTGPNTNHILENVKVNGVSTPVVSAGGIIHGKLVASIPIGPTWFGAGGKFVLGADQNGRDVTVRLLYGGRTSLFVGIVSSAICVFFAVILALVAAYYGGWGDFIITRFFDLMYAFPVILLGDRARLGALDQRLPPLRHQHPEREHLDPDADHLVRARSVHRPSAARTGAVAAREGVHRGVDRRRARARSGSCSSSCSRTSRAPCSCSSR